MRRNPFRRKKTYVKYKKNVAFMHSHDLPDLSTFYLEIFRTELTFSFVMYNTKAKAVILEVRSQKAN